MSISGQSPRCSFKNLSKYNPQRNGHTHETPRQYVTIELAAEPRATAGIPRRLASSTISHTSKKYGARCSFSITPNSCVSRDNTSGRSGR